MLLGRRTTPEILLGAPVFNVDTVRAYLLLSLLFACSRTTPPTSSVVAQDVAAAGPIDAMPPNPDARPTIPDAPPTIPDAAAWAPAVPLPDGVLVQLDRKGLVGLTPKDANTVDGLRRAFPWALVEREERRYCSKGHDVAYDVLTVAVPERDGSTVMVRITPGSRGPGRGVVGCGGSPAPLVGDDPGASRLCF